MITRLNHTIKQKTITFKAGFKIHSCLDFGYLIIFIIPVSFEIFAKKKTFILERS